MTMNKTRFGRGALAVLCLGVAGVIGFAYAAPDSPVEELTPVEASKNLELPGGASDEAAVAQGRYLVGLLGCASCHTEGALVGKPDPSKTLAGSTIGIAYSNPMVNDFPGAVYPPNLTPDRRTGLGTWTTEEIVDMIRSGKNRPGVPVDME